ncbi:MAG: cell division protein ZapA [Bacillota bacterium]|jgi:cell division protein ZapA (FtsZ GTPase activity inhibitor)
MLMLPEQGGGGAGQVGTRVSTVIFGEEYVIRGDADAERIESLARQIDSRMRAIAEVNPRLSTHQVAVLSALNLMGELVISERRYNELLNLLEQV